MDEISPEQKRYLKLLENWKNSGTGVTFKEYVLANGYTTRMYNEMMLKHPDWDNK